MSEETGAEADEDAVAIHCSGGGFSANCVHERSADDDEDAAECVPGHVVSVCGEDSTVPDNSEDHKEDKWEETDSGIKRRVTTCVLEVDGHHVDGDEDCGSTCSSHGKQDEDCAGLEELDWEDAAGCVGKDRVDLLEAEEDEEDAGADKAPDDGTAIPGILDTSE